MSKERELLKRVIKVFDSLYSRDLINEIKELLAQPEQEPSSDDFMYNKLKESYDELVESSFKEFQRGYGAALSAAVYMKEPKREPVSDGQLEVWYSQHTWAMDKQEYIWGFRDAEKAHGIGVDDE